MQIEKMNKALLRVESLNDKLIKVDKLHSKMQKEIESRTKTTTFILFFVLFCWYASTYAFKTDMTTNIKIINIVIFGVALAMSVPFMKTLAMLPFLFFHNKRFTKLKMKIIEKITEKEQVLMINKENSKEFFKELISYRDAGRLEEIEEPLLNKIIDTTFGIKTMSDKIKVLEK